MSIKETNFDIVQGDSWRTVVLVKDSSQTPLNFDGYTFQMEVRDKEGGHILCATASLGDGIENLGDGKIRISLTTEKTRKFILPRSKYQLVSIDPTNIRKTLIQGWFNVHDGVIG
jgi:hypothetical protein